MAASGLSFYLYDRGKEMPSLGGGGLGSTAVVIEHVAGDRPIKLRVVPQE